MNVLSARSFFILQINLKKGGEKMNKVKKAFVAVLATMPLLAVSLPAFANDGNWRNSDRHDRDHRDRHDRDRFKYDRDRHRDRHVIYVNYRFGHDFRAFDPYFGYRYSDHFTNHQKQLLERFLHSLSPSQKEDLMDLLRSLSPYQRALLFDFLRSLDRNQRHDFVKHYRDFHDRNWNDWYRWHQGDNRGGVPSWFTVYGF
jgi:hypothetical protein